MPTKLKYKARTENGLFIAPSMLRKEVIENWPNSNLIIEIRRDTKKRTSPENSYYWVVIVVYFLRGLKDSGESWLSENNPEHLKHVHEVIKTRFFFDSAPDIRLPDGTTEKGSLTTTNETTVSWEEKMTQIRSIIYEWFGITCPLPNEYDI